MTTPDTIRQHAEAEARRIAYESGDPGANNPRAVLALMHRAMMEELRPYFAQKAKIMAMAPVQAVIQDGRFVAMPPKAPLGMESLVEQLDDLIRQLQEPYKVAMLGNCPQDVS